MKTQESSAKQIDELAVQVESFKWLKLIRFLPQTLRILCNTSEFTVCPDVSLFPARGISA